MPRTFAASAGYQLLLVAPAVALGESMETGGDRQALPSQAPVDLLLGAALALLGGGFWPVAPWPTALGFLAMALLWAQGSGALRLLVWSLLFGLGALRAGHALERYDDQRFAFQRALGVPRRCFFVGEVVSSPVRKHDALSFLADVSLAECEGVALAEPFRARLYGGQAELARGDRISGTVDLAAAQLFRNFNVADPRPGAARGGAVASGGLLALSIEARGAGPGAFIDRARAYVRGRILATFPALAAPLARALVLGESDLDAEDAAAFRLSGLSHLLAVSGTHLVFAVVSLVNALGFLLVRLEAFAASVRAARLAALFGVVLSLAYADFAGGSGSAFRAAYMLSVGFTVTAYGRRPSAVRCLAASMLIFAVQDPLAGFDVSFLLSVAATAGLIGLGPKLGRLADWLKPRPLSWFVRSLTTTLSAMIPCLPLLALLSAEVGAAGLLANVLAAPFGEMAALPLCLLHAVAAWSPPLEHGLALSGAGALLVVRAIARFSAEQAALRVALPLPNAFETMLICVAFAAAFARRRFTGPGLLVLGCALLLGLWVSERAVERSLAPRGKLVATVLDVAQGDSTLLDFPDGSTWLIDGGGFVGSPLDPGLSVIVPELRARRRTHLDVMVLSHPHPDHFLGLESVIEAVSIGEFWDTGQGLAQGAGPTYARIRRRLKERGVPVLGPAELCGARTRFGVRVEVLAPCPSFRGEWGANDNSFVIRLGMGRRAFLFTGDAEHEAEAGLLERGANLAADFLKVGHHGSRTSTSPVFLERVQPALATISTGVRNRFGHPHPQTLATLRAQGVQALRTDQRGAIRIATDGAALEVTTVTMPR